MRLRSGLALVVLAGCAPGPPIFFVDPPHRDQLSITVHNETGSGLCEVHIYAASTTEPGHNWLDADAPPEIASGASRAFWVPKHDPADTYQVSASGCAGQKRPLTGYAPSVFMNVAASVVLFDEANPSSRDAAQAIAHTNENTTLIPAKFSRRTPR